MNIFIKLPFLLFVLLFLISSKIMVDYIAYITNKGNVGLYQIDYNETLYDDQLRHHKLNGNGHFAVK